MTSQPDAGGHFGPYGGRFVPEVLMAPLEELEHAYHKAAADPAFQAELADLLHNYAGRPTPLYYAKRLSETLGGARIYLKREDLNHTGAHKINNTIGQALLASRMGKTRIIAETGAGRIGRITPAGAVTEFPIPTPSSGADGIAVTLSWAAGLAAAPVPAGAQTWQAQEKSSSGGTLMNLGSSPSITVNDITAPSNPWILGFVDSMT